MARRSHIKKLDRWSALFAGLTLLIAGTVLAGWIFHVRPLVEPWAAAAAMQFNSALCFVLLSLPLLIKTRRLRSSMWWSLIPVVILAALNLTQALGRIDLGIDELFITHFIKTRTTHPGRMAPNSAIGFLMGAAALLLVVFNPKSKVALLKAFMLASMTLMFGATALACYFSGFEMSYGWGNLTQMAFNTAVAFTLVGISLLLHLMSIAAADGLTSTSMRAIAVGLLIAIFGIYIWQALSRDELAAMHRSTTVAVANAKDRLEIRLSEVDHALRRMAERLTFGMDSRAWQADATYYAHDFPPFDALFITDENGTILNQADALSDNVILPEVLNRAWNVRRQWRPNGAMISELIPVGKNEFLFLFTLPIKQAGAERQLAVLVNAREFFEQILTQSFVAPGYSLSASVDGVEFVSRVAPGVDNREYWSVDAAMNIARTPWVMTAWPNERTLGDHTSPLPLVVLCSTVGFGLLVMFAFHLAAVSRQAKAMAEEATEAKSNFLANMSHEIRTPLTAMIGFTETLLTDELPPAERVDALQTIERNCSHLLRLINDILDLSKIEAKKLEIDKVPVSLAELLSDIANFHWPTAEEKRLSFGFEYDYPVPDVITTDPLRLKQILVNLIGNALKFTDIGGVKVHVSYSPDEEIISFAVIDTGIGISDEQRARLFQAFSQADASTTRKFGGTGLGLIISAQLAERLGGSIKVESVRGRGSVFIASVATGPVAATNLVWKVEQRSSGVTARDRAEGLNLSGRILLAEDGIDNRRYVTYLLKKLGLDVTVVDNGLSAVEHARTQPFDLILMDMQMPIMDGYTAVAELRKSGCTVPIIAFTANAMSGDIERCKRAGSTDFLGKPFSRQEFIDKMRTYITAEGGTVTAVESGSPAPDSAEPPSGDDPTYQQLIAHFEEGLERRLAAFRDAYTRSDYGELEALAHQLRGSGGLYGHSTLSELCGKVEKGAADRSKELPELISAVERYVRTIRDAH